MEEDNIIEDELFTKLPIELTGKIIHSGSYADAATMREVSKKWKDFWDTVTVQDGGIEDLYGSLESFLDHIDDCDPIGYPWNLFYQFGMKNFLYASVLGNWQLRLNFSKLNSKSTSMFHLALKPGDQHATPPPPPPLISSTFYVKTLRLRSVSHLTYSTVSSLVTTFNFLENLYVEECTGLHSLHVSTPELKELIIIDCYQLSTLHLNTPKLESFKYRGPRPWIMVDGRDRYELKDAMLDFRQGARSKHLGSSPVLLLSSLMNVTCATVCAWSYQEVITSRLHLRCDKFKLAQLKELCWIEREIDVQRIQVLLSFLNLCPNLEKLFIVIDVKSCKIQGMMKGVDGSTCGAKLANLEVVKIEGCKDERDETLVVEHLLDASVKDPKIISKLRNKNVWRLMSREFSLEECASRNHGSSYTFHVLHGENTWFSHLKHLT